MSYSWVSIFEELADEIRGFEDKQSDLVALLRESGVTGGLKDKDEKDREIDLEEMDPFTFFSQIVKHKEEKIKKILASLKERLFLKSPLPTDLKGVPSTFALSARYFPARGERDVDDTLVIG